MTTAVGDRVLYFPGSFDPNFATTSDAHPLAAIVAFVPDPLPAPPPGAPAAEKVPTTVNLMVIDQNGWTHSRTNVILLADGEKPVPETPYAGLPTWAKPAVKPDVKPVPQPTTQAPAAAVKPPEPAKV